MKKIALLAKAVALATLFSFTLTTLPASAAKVGGYCPVGSCAERGGAYANNIKKCHPNNCKAPTTNVSEKTKTK